MITLIEQGEYIQLQGVAGTIHDDLDFALRKDLVRRVKKGDVDDAAVTLISINDVSFTLEVGSVQTSSGTTYTDIDVLYADVMTFLNDIDDTFPYLGAWDAINNSPVIASGGMYDSNGDGTANQQAVSGNLFIVSSADTTPANNTTIDGINDWSVGDRIVFNGSVWERIPPSAFGTTSADSVTYDNSTTGFSPAVNNVQDAIEAVDAKIDALSIDDLTDVDTSTDAPNTNDVLQWNGTNWVPGTSSGRAFYIVIGTIDTTTSPLPSADGNYLVTETITNPIAADTNDIINLASATWTSIVDASSTPAGSVEYQQGRANFVWDGTKWSAIDAYEPATAFLTANVTNPIGTIGTNLTGSDLAGKSISEIIDMMLFSIVYNPPIAPAVTGVSGSLNRERGALLDDTFTPVYVQNGGGALTEWSGRADSFFFRALSAGPFTTIDTNTIDVGDAGLNAVLRRAAPFANSERDIAIAYRYADGPIPTDNIGTEHPSDQILSGLAQVERTYTARYPIWIGATPERFTISTDINESTDINIAPNGGTNTSGTLFNATWVANNFSTAKQLFVNNYTNSSAVAVTSTGNTHLFVIAPPGITVTRIQENVLGIWTDLIAGTHYNSFTESGFNSAAGNEPRSYTVYYLRHLSATTLPLRTLRFSTAGTVIP